MLLGLVLAAAAAATSPAKTPRVDWARRPTVEELSDNYPAQALSSNAIGTVVVDCDVQLDGSLARCAVESEEPKGLGFGEAALKMSAAFRMTSGVPNYKGARPIVRVPVHFYPRAQVLRFPTPAQYRAAYPPSAARSGLPGLALLDCQARADGVVEDCHVTAEQPPGEGFGDAALTLAPDVVAVPAPKGMPDANRQLLVPIAFMTWPVIKVPSAQEIMAAYPAKPRAAGVSGKVELDCLIDSTGILSGCTVKSESPPNQGFGTAALALAPDFAAKSITPPVALQSVLQPVLQTITVNFDPDPQKIAALNAPARAEAVDAHGDPIDWVRRPTADELSDAYPAQALKTRATGSAIIDCDVQLDGSLSRCVVESEEPNGLGFGEAAVKMSANFRMTAGAPDFRGARPRVRVPVSFNPGDAGGGSGTWVRQPSTEELAAAYPVVARNKKIEGWATLACEVKSDGALSGCVVGSEEPEGMGFGEAALGLAPSFLMPPGTPDAFGKRPAVSVPLHFVPPGS